MRSLIFLVRSHILELFGLSCVFSVPWTNTLENPHGNEKEIGCIISL